MYQQVLNYCFRRFIPDSYSVAISLYNKMTICITGELISERIFRQFVKLGAR